MAKRGFDSKFILQIVLGVALVVFGIMALNGYNSAGQEAMRGLNKMFGKSNNLFPLIFAIVQVAAGAFLIAELFVSLGEGLFRIIHLVICIFWIVNIVMNFIMSNFIEPDLLRWLGAICPQLIFLISLWMIGEDR